MYIMHHSRKKRTQKADVQRCRANTEIYVTCVFFGDAWLDHDSKAESWNHRKSTMALALHEEWYALKSTLKWKVKGISNVGS